MNNNFKQKFCSRCLYSSDHPLGIIINKNGLCSGCTIHEEKNSLDWEFRLEKLKKLVNDYKLKNSNKYDCIVPITGANDSYFILYVVKHILGLNPLLVNYNKYFNTPLGVHNLANLRITFDCDILVQNINPISVKKITRTTLREFGSVYWPILAGHTVFPVQIAVKKRIPLIIWGAHQGLEQVGMFSHKHEVEMSRRYRKDHDLLGFEADDLLSVYDFLNEEDIWQYRYPDDFDINNVGVRGIYLGNFIRWDPKAQHEKMISLFNYKTTKFNRTFDCYDHVDCYNYMDIHDLLKLYKNGYSKVTDHACREIRFNRISKSEGLFLVQKFENAKLKYLDLFCNWLGIEQSSLNFILNECRNEKFWIRKDYNEWEFNGLSLNQKKYKKSSTFHESFISTKNNKIKEPKNKYITIGKGWP